MEFWIRYGFQEKLQQPHPTHPISERASAPRGNYILFFSTSASKRARGYGPNVATMTSEILLRKGHATVPFRNMFAGSKPVLRKASLLAILFDIIAFYGFQCLWLCLLEHRKTKGRNRTQIRLFYRNCWRRKRIDTVRIVELKVLNMEFAVFVRLPLQVLLWFCLKTLTSWWLICLASPTTGPRWASWNLGVFLCIRCAGIHRNLGVHISRVKSVNLDSWTPEQMEVSCSVCFFFDLFGREFLLTLVLLSLVFRVSSNGEISELRSFGNVIYQVISVARRPTRTIQTHRLTQM